MCDKCKSSKKLSRVLIGRKSTSGVLLVRYRDVSSNDELNCCVPAVKQDGTFDSSIGNPETGHNPPPMGHNPPPMGHNPPPPNGPLPPPNLKILAKPCKTIDFAGAIAGLRKHFLENRSLKSRVFQYGPPQSPAKPQKLKVREASRIFQLFHLNKCMKLRLFISLVILVNS